MHRARVDSSPELRESVTTLLFLAAAALLTWTLLQSFGSNSGRHDAPSQAPAGQEPQHRGTPAYDQELIGALGGGSLTPRRLVG
jgi:hypothetical protein